MEKNNFIWVGIWLFLVTVCIISCAQTKGNMQKKDTRVEFTMIIPIVLSPIKADSGIVTAYITNAGKYMLYEMPRRLTWKEDGVLVKDTTVFDIFIHRKGATLGYLFTGPDSPAIKMAIDSAVGKRVPQGGNVEKMLPQYDYVRTYYLDDDHFIRMYRSSEANNEANTDSMYFHFSRRMKDCFYTLSPFLDSVFGAKLYQIENFAQKDTSVNAAYLNRFRTSGLSIREVPWQDEAALMRLIKRVDSLYQKPQ